jgi:hypothetical protein
MMYAAGPSPTHIASPSVKFLYTWGQKVKEPDQENRKDVPSELSAQIFFILRLHEWSVYPSPVLMLPF